MGVAHFFAVDPKIECGIDGSEDDRRAATIPCLRQRELVPVRTDLIAVLDGEVGKMLWRLTHHRRGILGKWIDDVCIDWDSVALHLPIGRHGDFFPSRVIECQGFEAGGFADGLPT